jgi:hypothetical protein
VDSLRLLYVQKTANVSSDNLLADLLDPDEWEALVDAGLIPPDYGPMRYAQADRMTIQEFEEKWLEREMKKRPTGPYARYLAGGPLPKGDDECPETERDGAS